VPFTPNTALTISRALDILTMNQMQTLLLRSLLATTDPEMQRLSDENYFIKLWLEQGSQRQLRISSRQSKDNFIKTFRHRGVLHYCYNTTVSLLNTIIVWKDSHGVARVIAPMCGLISLYNSICNLYGDESKIPTPAVFFALLGEEILSEILKCNGSLVPEYLLSQAFDELKKKLPILRDRFIAFITDQDDVMIYDGQTVDGFPIPNGEITRLKDLDKCKHNIVLLFCGTDEFKHFCPVQLEQIAMIPEEKDEVFARYGSNQTSEFVVRPVPFPQPIRVVQPVVSATTLVAASFDRQNSTQIERAFKLCSQLRVITANPYVTDLIARLECVVLQLCEGVQDNEEVRRLFADCSSVIFGHSL
jgi:hypothetical protein